MGHKKLPPDQEKHYRERRIAFKGWRGHHPVALAVFFTAAASSGYRPSSCVSTAFLRAACRTHIRAAFWCAGPDLTLFCAGGQPLVPPLPPACGLQCAPRGDWVGMRHKCAPGAWLVVASARWVGMGMSTNRRSEPVRLPPAPKSLTGATSEEARDAARGT